MLSQVARMASSLKPARILVVFIAVVFVACAGIAEQVVVDQDAASIPLLISANDQRFVLTDGIGSLCADPGPGSVTFMRMDGYETVTHLSPVPVSVVGPPKSLCVTPDGRTLLIASSMRTADKVDELMQVPDNRITVVDISGDNPRVIQTLSVGSQPSGLRVSPDGQFALVANRAEGTLTVLPIRSGVIGEGTATAVAPAKTGVADVAVSGDAKWILATMIDAGALVLANCEGGLISRIQTPVKLGRSPYAVEFIPGAEEAVIADVSECGMLHHVAIESGRIHHLDSIYVGIAAEGLSVSRDGRWIAVTCLENSLAPPDSPKRKQWGRLVLLHRSHLTRSIGIVGSIRTPRIPQAVAFTAADGSELVVGCYEDRFLSFYRFRDGRLVDTGRRVSTDGQPAALDVVFAQERGKYQ